MREQRLALVDEQTAINKDGKLQIDALKAETDRMGVQVDAQKAGAGIQLKRVQMRGGELDDVAKLRPFRGRIRTPPRGDSFDPRTCDMIAAQ